MNRAAQQGVTLVELLISIVIISICMVVLMRTMGDFLIRDTDSLWQAKVTEIGQAYLDEISTRRFDENSPNGGSPSCDSATGAACTVLGSFGSDASEARSAVSCVDTFDDVDDYNGVNNSPPLIFNETTGSSCVRANYTNYRVQVSVSYVGAALASTATDAKLIAITVTAPNGDAVLFSTIKGNF